MKKIFKKILEYFKEKNSQAYFLVRHFMQGLGSNELIKSENQGTEGLFAAIFLFSLVGGVISHNLLYKYLVSAVVVDPGVLWFEKSVFLTFMMAMTGIFCLIIWDNVFLDRKDYINLLTLPVKVKTLFITKFLSAFIFIGSIFLLFNIFSTLIFTAYIGSVVKTNLLWLAFSHLISNLLANLLVFLLLSAVQSVMMILFKDSLVRKLSVYTQLILFAGFISVFVWFPGRANAILQLKVDGSPLIYYFPPFWFTGLHEKLTGNPDTMFATAALIGLAAVILSLALYLLSFPISYKKYLKSTYGGRRRKKQPKPLMVLKNLFYSLALRHPIQIGMFHFTIKTLRRTLKHKLQLLIFIVIPVAMVVTKLADQYSQKGVSYFKTVSPYLISVPLILYFFLILGLRMAVAHPVMQPAGWVFRLTENKDKIHYTAGLKKGLFLFALFPLALFLFLFYLLSWGFKPAIYHSFYGIAIAILLMELFFVKYRKVPFVSSYLSGKARFKYFFLFYMTAFAAYMTYFTIQGMFLIKHPVYYPVFYGGVFVIYLLFKWYQYKGNKDFLFIYHEEPKPIFLSLNLEG